MSGKFTLLKIALNFIGHNVQVGNITNPGTPDLYALLFKKESVAYENAELEQYMDILKSLIQIERILKLTLKFIELLYNNIGTL